MDLLKLTPAQANMLQMDAIQAEEVQSTDTTPAGMWQVMSSMLENLIAVQNYEGNGLVPLSNTANTINLDLTDGWFKIMQNDESKINADIKKGGSGENAQVQADVTQFNIDNTMYNQSNSYYSGITSGVNQNASDASQTFSIDLQSYSQGPLTQLQTIAQAM